MRCYVCDKEDELITFDKLTGKYSPCGTCEDIIQETLDTYPEPEDNAPNE